ncbi:RNA-directed DNA polymerase from mobile element jockey [Pitangus sulphuratus]|nr:RNA-directed DNA polymerase from mobile element jockey [Pitangus sulphuratus]
MKVDQRKLPFHSSLGMLFHMPVSNFLYCDSQKVEEFNSCFGSVFSNVERPWAARSPELGGSRVQDFLFVDMEIVKDQLNIYKSMGPDGTHPRALQDPVDVMAGLLLIIYQRSWDFFVEALAGWKLGSVIPIYKESVRKDPGNYRPVSLT